MLRAAEAEAQAETARALIGADMSPDVNSATSPVHGARNRKGCTEVAIQEARDLLSQVRGSETLDINYSHSIMGSSKGSLPETGTGSILSSIQSAISSAAGSDEAASSASGDDFAADALDGSSWFSDVSESFAYDELPSSLELAETDDGYVVEMDDTLWDVLADFQVSVMQQNPKNGDEYTLLGSDNVWDTDADDNIVVVLDGTWTAIDGHIVSFFGDAPTALSDGTYSFTGTIPAILNGEERIDIVVYQPPDNQSRSYIQGWRSHEQTQSHVFGHGFSGFSPGDEIAPPLRCLRRRRKLAPYDDGRCHHHLGPQEYQGRLRACTRYRNLFWGTLTTVYGDAIDTEVLVVE